MTDTDSQAHIYSPDSLGKLKPYLALLLPFKWTFIGAILCGVAFGVSSGFGLPFMVAKIFPIVFAKTTPEFLVLVGAVLWLPFVFFIRGISGFYNVYLLGFCGIKLLEEIRLRVFKKLQELPLSYYEKHNTGDILSRTMNDTNQIQMSLTIVANDLIRQPLTLLGALSAVVYLSIVNDQVVFILFSFMIVPLSVFPIRFIGRRLYKRAKSMQSEMGMVTDVVRENLSAVREVRAFNMQARQTDQFMDTVRRFFSMQLKVIKYTKVLSPVIEFVASIGIAVAIFYAARIGVKLEEVVALITALYLSYDPIKKLGAVHNEAKRGIASLNRLEDILNEPVEIDDKPNARIITGAKGKIHFNRVSFSYGEGPVLHKVDCTLEPNIVYALVGPSGAGKSTFANLIPRFYDPVEGTVSLDQTDIRDITQNSLREQIAIVSQDPVLFNDTIFNNIRLSNPAADREAVYEACQNAFAHSFIETFDKGYETIVGERGARLSGGQKQRIALARAFLKNAPILILDEATSALDAESEEKIQAALKKLVQDKTVVMIAHRFSSIRLVDEIVVFDAGEILGQGSHEKLFESCKLYRELYERQNLGG